MKNRSACLIKAIFVAIIIGGTIFSATVHANTNDFTISDFTADYYLHRLEDGRSQLRTVERITAQFPGFNQNHGIERAIPQVYDGHTTGLNIVSVEDESQRRLPYTTYRQNDNEIVRIGDKDRYVHGKQTYIITYDLQDVTKNYKDNNRSEFYWDTNGTEWKVPIEQLRATLHISSALGRERQNKAQYCYIGVAGSRERCDIDSTYDDDNGATTTVSSTRRLAAGENITMAVGFQANTFANYQPTLIERLMGIWRIATNITIGVAFALIVWLVIRLKHSNSRSRERMTIVTEYLPPAESSVTASAQVLNAPRSVMTAQLLDLAVRHYVKLYQVKEKMLFSPAQYEIEIIKDIADLKQEEQEIVKDMFDNHTTVNSRLNLKTLQNNTAFYKRTLNNDSDLAKLIRGKYALREKKPQNVTWFRRVALISAVVSILMFSIPMAFAALLAFIFSFNVWSLTDKGLALKRYLDGLKQYIGVAEAKRLRMLQSPEGSTKVSALIGNNRVDEPQLIKLYERVLPYAVLFGQEKQWNRQLGAYYEHAGKQPEWYSGNSTTFNAAVFTGAMSSFSTSTNTYAASSSSGSSGSSGGGSSGGGGGGGGGGGW